MLISKVGINVKERGVWRNKSSHAHFSQHTSIGTIRTATNRMVEDQRNLKLGICCSVNIYRYILYYIVYILLIIYDHDRAN